MPKQNKINVKHNSSSLHKPGATSKTNQMILRSGEKINELKFDNIDVIFKKAGDAVSLTDLLTNIVESTNQSLINSLNYDLNDKAANLERKKLLDKITAQAYTQRNYLLHVLYTKIKADKSLLPQDITPQYLENLPEFNQLKSINNQIKLTNQIVQPIQDSVSALLNNTNLTEVQKTSLKKIEAIIQSLKILLLDQLIEKDSLSITDDYLASLAPYKMLKYSEELLNVSTIANGQEPVDNCLKNMNQTITDAAQNSSNRLWSYAKKIMRALAKVAIHASAGAAVGAGVGGAAAATIAVANFWNGGTFSAPAWPTLIGGGAALGALGGTVKAIREMAANGVPANSKELNKELVKVVDETGSQIGGVAKNFAGNASYGLFSKADKKFNEGVNNMMQKVDESTNAIAAETDKSANSTIQLTSP